MHDYNIENKERIYVLYIIAITSIVLILIFQDYANLLPWWLKIPSPLFVFSLLLFLFDRFIWRWLSKIKIIQTPNLNGIYEGQLTSSLDRFQKSYNTEILIKQTWTKILIVCQTPDSLSLSKTASILIKAGDLMKLAYIYQNDPKPSAPKSLNIHYGTCEHLIDFKKNTFDGYYYTGRSRNSHGELFLKKNSSEINK